jgi:hypothetical protein
MGRKIDRSAWRFFHENAGGIVGQSAIGAASLARAESALRLAEYHDQARVRFDFDADTDLSWMTDAERKQEHECLSAVLEVRCASCQAWEVRASLGGIVDADRDYLRIISAKLACEAGLDRAAQATR